MDWLRRALGRSETDPQGRSRTVPPTASAGDGGALSYHGLLDWWFREFSADERRHIETVYQPMGLTLDDDDIEGPPRPLTQGTITFSSQTAAGLLWGLAGWFNKPGQRHLALRILAKARELATASGNALDLHFTLTELVQVAYRERESSPDGLERAIAACEDLIAIAPAAASALRRAFSQSAPPMHVGFDQLAIVREKQGDFPGAIALAREAKSQGWAGEWDNRIARCEARIARAASKRR